MSENIEPEDDLRKVLNTSRRIMREVGNALQEAHHQLCDLAETLNIEWDLQEEDPTARGDDSAAVLGELLQVVASCVRKARHQEASVETQLAFYHPGFVGELQRTWNPPVGSLADALLPALKRGTSVVLEPKDVSIASLWEVRGALFLLRALGWPIDSWQCSEGNARAYGIGDEYATLNSLRDRAPTLVAEERGRPQ
jgi:hypothetical protein